MGPRAQGQGVDEVPEGYHFRFDLIVLSNHVLKGAYLVGIASEAGFRMMQLESVQCTGEGAGSSTFVGGTGIGADAVADMLESCCVHVQEALREVQ
jgi:hypothetical protein